MVEARSGVASVAELLEVVERLQADVLRGLDDADARDALAGVVRAGRQVEACRSLLIRQVSDRARQVAREQTTGNGSAAAEQAERRVRSELAQELRLTPSEVSQAQQVGRLLRDAGRVDEEHAAAGGTVAGPGLEGFDAPDREGIETPDRVASPDRDGVVSPDRDGVVSPDRDGVAAAVAGGEVPVRHAAKLAETLRRLGPEDRDRARVELLDAARRLPMVEFSRVCQRVLARFDPGAAAAADELRRSRRSARSWPDPDDPAVRVLHARLSGWEAETVLTGIEAFRTVDAVDAADRRRPEQCTADALVAMAAAALAAGSGPTRHGVRPHVTVVLRQVERRRSGGPAGTEAVGGAGEDGEEVTVAEVAELEHVRPVSLAHVRRHLTDVGVSRLVLDADGVPTEVSGIVRTVPAGLHRVLLVRDGGCIADGCDVPARWCEVMHLEVPHRVGGRLGIDTAALGCRFHHERYDRGHLQLVWQQRRPVLRDPRRPRPRPPP